MRDDIPNPAGDPGGEDSTTDILEFLDSAPAEVREWAERMAQQVRAEHEAELARDDDEPGDVDVADDDALVRRRNVTTPADLRTEPPPFRASQRKGWHPSTVILATLVVAALVFGVYWIGQPEPEPVVAQQAQMGAAQEAPVSTVDMARLAELEQLLAEDPTNVDAHLEIGVLLIGLGDLERAEHHWLRATMEAPENPQAWFNLGFLYLSQDPPDMEAAESAWRMVLQVAPESDEAEVVRGHMGTMLGIDPDAPATTQPEPGPSPSPTGSREG